MSFFNIIVLLVGMVLIGVILFYIRASDKIDAGFKKLIYVVLAVALVIFLLQIFGLWGALKNLGG